MTNKKLIVVAHGIGDTEKGFEKEWKAVLDAHHDLSSVVVRGLWWEDVLQDVANRYPLVSRQFTGILSMCGFSQLEKLAGSDKAKLFLDYIMDVLVYVGLQEMWLHIQNKCLEKLDTAIKGDATNEGFEEKDVILIGHSLGAAMLPQLVWKQYARTGFIPYRGMILLASPIGFESPKPDLCQDFLQRMGVLLGGTRTNVLEGFSKAWRSVGKNRLKLVCNENDIVCSDVKYEIPGTGQLVDLIPLRQGLNPAEIALVNAHNPNAIEFISFGRPNPKKILANHDVCTYLAQPVFNNALEVLL